MAKSSTTIPTKNKLDEALIIKVSRFKEKIKRTVPHKHDDYFELIFLSEGEGFHWIESDRFQIKTPEFYFLQPGQMHCWQFTSIPKGFVVLFRESFFNDVHNSETVNLYKLLAKKIRIPINSKSRGEFILNEILTEYQTNSTYSVQIIQGLLKAVFGRLLQLAESVAPLEGLPKSKCDNFMALLSTKCPGMYKVKDYAALLNTTPQTLNASCMKQTGKSASSLISAQMLIEAKRYLLHTENTISEIAQVLCLNDASYFVKFFKKAEGITPVQFRQNYFQ